MEQYILFDPSASSGRRVLLLQGISGSGTINFICAMIVLETSVGMFSYAYTGKTQIAYNFCVRNFERYALSQPSTVIYYNGDLGSPIAH